MSEIDAIASKKMNRVYSYQLPFPQYQLSWAEWLYFQLIQPPPPGKVYFSRGANLVSKVEQIKQAHQAIE